ncbi:TlpA disulfide reductase family protein [Mesobacillus sp. AQ2]|jgi:thiol-disulfide isomerase/thioredoxin|uniref:TlpA family protein disulfide reductase n=1 Tax=unclassified Mesobacillus TaxID=2675270 RepID=UPI00203C1AE2|nr:MULTISPECIES: TlpA disulfide reductase family protein [unclassified Mesobacillus]MCM3123488.1 TlpA family protein disulfide reductase [Mesobacillus sp. MER 33]MCM3233029.1 TlpA family protein disulfide reductase [Mesobacillus sp. MER 48]WHX42104.1 TlpA disulfide reductase family protein [Mesobacillus sp. AQ2]
MRLRQTMPEISGATEWLNGEITREQLVGEKPALIHFWSISCHLCKVAMPMVNELRDTYKDKLNVMSVHMPRSEQDMNMDEIKQTAAEHQITQPIFIDDNLKLTDAFENKYVPAYYLFDKNGLLRHFQAGGSGMKMLEKRLVRIIDETENNE